MSNKRNKWDQRYLKLAYGIAQWSKDPSSKIGAVTVGAKGQVLSQGFNGFPRGLKDDYDRLNDRETKYKYVVHAEMNAIYNATYNGTSLDGATLYVYGLPTCSECAKGVIQVGIKRVVMPASPGMPEKWKDSWLTSMSFFREAGVDFDFIDFDPRTESGE
jgi:dCMP deaminase